jgi:DHA1 family multidrug resistance protein-like MFS transporter
VQAGTSVVVPILPLFIQHLTPNAQLVGTVTGTILASSSIAAALAAAGLGRISWRLGYERTLHMALGGACLLAIPQAFVTSPWQLLALRTVGALFLGGTLPTINALIAARVDRERQGTVFGLSSAINSAGYATGSMVGASMAAAFGYPSVFWVTAGALALTAFAARIVIRPRRAER